MSWKMQQRRKMAQHGWIQNITAGNQFRGHREKKKKGFVCYGFQIIYDGSVKRMPIEKFVHI